jgi:aspartate-semialdehyde dehydrogenase
MTDVSVAVVGATGVVGREMIATLERRSFPVGELRLMASSRSAGKVIQTAWGEVKVEDLAEAEPAGIEVALYSAGGARSLEHAPRFADAGAIVVDNSSAWRMHSDVPLVVVGVNDHAVAQNKGIIANPNCTTMALLMAIGPLHRAAGVEFMTVSSYQSVSGSGQAAIDTLISENEKLGRDPDALREGGWQCPGDGFFPRPIGWNVLPLAGDMAEDGYTVEEWKLVYETRKILESPDIAVEPTCVRVPVVTGHGMAASAWFGRPMGSAEAAELIEAAPGVELWHDKVPTSLDCVGIDDVLVGRLRDTVGRGGGVSLWVVGDNLRKGAALNTVQIAEIAVSVGR